MVLVALFIFIVQAFQIRHPPAGFELVVLLHNGFLNTIFSLLQSGGGSYGAGDDPDILMTQGVEVFHSPVGGILVIGQDIRTRDIPQIAVYQDNRKTVDYQFQDFVIECFIMDGKYDKTVDTVFIVLVISSFSFLTSLLDIPVSRIYPSL